jgi:hypothetical protein
MRFVPLGVGDAFSALYYSSSLLVIAADGASESRLLTHLHDDHVNSFEYQCQQYWTV